MKKFLVAHEDGSPLDAPAIVIKVTEPYAEEIFDILRKHENIQETFEEFCKELWRDKNIRL